MLLHGIPLIFKITRGSENFQFEKIHNAMLLGWQLSDCGFVNTT